MRKFVVTVLEDYSIEVSEIPITKECRKMETIELKKCTSYARQYMGVVDIALQKAKKIGDPTDAEWAEIVVEAKKEVSVQEAMYSRTGEAISYSSIADKLQRKSGNASIDDFVDDLKGYFRSRGLETNLKSKVWNHTKNEYDKVLITNKFEWFESSILND